MKEKKGNIFFELVPVEDWFDASQVITSGYKKVPALKRKGYRYISGEDRYVRSRNKLELKPAGILALGLITYAGIEFVRLLLK